MSQQRIQRQLSWDREGAFKTLMCPHICKYHPIAPKAMEMEIILIWHIHEICKKVVPLITILTIIFQVTDLILCWIWILTYTSITRMRSAKWFLIQKWSQRNWKGNLKKCMCKTFMCLKKHWEWFIRFKIPIKKSMLIRICNSSCNCNIMNSNSNVLATNWSNSAILIIWRTN